MSEAAKLPVLSVIMPCWRDAQEVACRLAELSGWSKLGREVEIIISAVECEAGAWAPVELREGVRVVPGVVPNRGAQLLAGVEAARGAAFLFHHADTPWTPAHLDSLLRAVEQDADIGGAFYRDTAAMYPAWSRWDGLVRWWHRSCGTLLGDQSLFCSRSRYARAGGLRPLPILEDVDFSRRLRRSGPVTLMDPPIRHSLRRFAAGGGIRLRLMNFTVLALFRLGVSADTLHRLYYRRDARAGKRASSHAPSAIDL